MFRLFSLICRSLLTSEGLYSIFSNNLNPTNVYLEFELHDLPKTLPNSNSNPTLFSKDFFVAPPSCKDIHIHLVHKPTANFDKRQLKCCKELQIFEDIISLNLGKVEAGRDAETKDGVPVSMVGENVAWWESETVVRGFKEQAVKGCNMWS